MLDDYCRYYTVKENDLIIDLGAAVGDFGKSILTDIRSKNAFLVCVEPAMWSINILSHWINSELSPNGMLLSSTVWKENGIQKMNIATSYLLNSVSEAGQDISKWGNQSVVRVDTMPALTLDTIMSLFGNDREISFVKSDIEGAELEAFLYCQNIRRIKQMAIGAYHTRDGEQTYHKLLPFIRSQGYTAEYEQNVLYATRVD